MYHRAERQAAASGTISRVNKLVSSYSEGEGPELTQAVQELCQQSDALILAVDSSKTEGEGERDSICSIRLTLTLTLNLCILLASFPGSPHMHS